MAGKNYGKHPPRRRKRVGLRVGAAILAVFALGAGWMHMNARVLHVRYAEVALADLPDSFDGTTVLYATDFDVCGLNTIENVDRMFTKLQALNPDLLLLGGDYASPSLLDRLNGKTGADEKETRRAFFESVADFYAPLGKLAISGDNDGDRESLLMQMMGSNVQLIDDNCAILDNGTDKIGVMGIGANTTDVNRYASAIDSSRCVIALMHSPSKVTDVQIAEAKNGGAWTDLILAGHTHGGQLQIAGRTALNLNDSEKRYLAGWYTDSTPLLVSSGVGCEGANFRFGSQAEVWMITLKCKV